ncbi:MAG TPA: murein L,D-transpeptidase catalytic domain family protein [Xanthomonadaceae bacterium]|nr:murein L,D-transpeptidase catalytic domain family protein [Xanthomonadaceae bacterium]
MGYRFFRYAVAALAALAPGAHAADALEPLARAAPDADRAVLELAVRAHGCAVRHAGLAPARRLAVIDYSRPSTEPRLWVFDLREGTLLHREHVAHGRGTGANMATAFSNHEGSHQSSLGLFATAETYTGGNGYSLRMDGLEPGFNDRARERLIVMHGADYVDPDQASRQGRLGRSFGCPAVRPEVAQQVIDALKQGQVLFAYYPDPQWLARSRLLACEGAPATQVARVDGGAAAAALAAAATAPR